MAKGNPNAKRPEKTRKIHDEKLEAIVQAFITNGHNKKNAVLAAGYSEHTASAKATELFKHPYIVARLKDIMQESKDKTGVTHEKMLKDLKNISDSDIGKFLDDNNDFVIIKKLKPELRKQIKSFKKTITKKDGVEKITIGLELFDKLTAKNMINKHIGFYNEDNQQKTTVIKVGFKE